MFTRNVTGFRVHSIRDSILQVPLSAFTGSNPFRAAEILGSDPGTVQIAVNCYLIEAEDGHTCLCDTGIGTVMNGMQGSLPHVLTPLLARAPDVIFLSHLHIDHIGGLVSLKHLVGDHTVIMIPQAEIDWWSQPGFPEGAPENQGQSRAVVAALLDRYRPSIIPVSPDVTPLPGLAQMPLPGHTPGHTGLKVGEDSLWILGDVVHDADLQCEQPDWGFAADVDAPLAARTRHEALERAADSNVLIGGIHLPGPGFGRIRRKGAAFSLDHPNLPGNPRFGLPMVPNA